MVDPFSNFSFTKNDDDGFKLKEILQYLIRPGAVVNPFALAADILFPHA